MQKLNANELVHITESVLRALAQNRILTILDFLQEDSEKLTSLTKLSLPQILDIRNDILSKYSAPLLAGPSILAHNVMKRKYISTGIPSLDAVLGGGIVPGHITEVCGLAEAGKTELCLQLAINCVKSYNDIVMYVDAKGDFSACRTQEILERCGCSHKEMAKIMHKIQIAHVWTMDELLELFKNLKNKTVPMENLLMIIVDSLPCLMFQYLGDENKVGLTFLNMLVNYSRYLCKEFNLAIIFINIQTRWLEQDILDADDDGEQTSTREMATEKRNRCLGKYWQYIPAFLIMLEKQHSSISNERNSTQIEVTVAKEFGMKCEKKCTLSISYFGVS